MQGTSMSIKEHPARLFVAVQDPGVRRWAVVLGANEGICDHVRVGQDRRSRLTFTRSHLHSFTPWTTVHRRTPGSGTATNMQCRLGYILGQQCTRSLHLTYT